MDQGTLESARENLVRIGLIAWKRPLYQVLALDVHPPDAPRQPASRPLSIGEILKKAAGGAS
jgi:hypothetical protein